jgi:hypothetical protein
MPEIIMETEAAEAGAAAEVGLERALTIAEAVLLAVVALLAAWSGYCSEKWSTESRLELATAATARTNANRAETDATATKNFDASTFNAWFSAYVAGNQQAMDLAEKRFRPAYLRAFDAWQATDPESNPNSPPGPSYMPEYVIPDDARATRLNERADEASKAGTEAAGHADEYVRVTVYFATVLFFIGISRHFPLRGARYGLLAVAVVILVFAFSSLLTLPRPPG